MSYVTKMDHIPGNSLVLMNFGKIDYYDAYQISKKTNDTIDKITTKIFKMPVWVQFLLKVRDSIVGIFGLRTGDMKDPNTEVFYPIGSKAVYFTVLDRNDNEIVMAETDKHLNFRVSVLIERNDTISKIYLTTAVKFNNIWGRLYFWPVKPFHRLIIRSILKRPDNPII